MVNGRSVRFPHPQPSRPMSVQGRCSREIGLFVPNSWLLIFVLTVTHTNPRGLSFPGTECRVRPRRRSLSTPPHVFLRETFLRLRRDSWTGESDRHKCRRREGGDGCRWSGSTLVQSRFRRCYLLRPRSEEASGRPKDPTSLLSTFENKNVRKERDESITCSYRTKGIVGDVGRRKRSSLSLLLLLLLFIIVVVISVDARYMMKFKE